MKTTTTLLLTACCLLLTASLNAQTGHEFSIYGGGGLSTLNYKVTPGEQKIGFGGHAGLGYTFFFSPNWGLGTGVELGLYNSKFELKNLTTNYTAVDDTETPPTNFDFRSTISNYKETQRAIMLQIPLMLQFQTNGNHKFYAAAGAKVGLPIKASYKVDNATLETSGYYAYESYTYTVQIFRGFGSNQKSYEDDLSLKAAFFVSAEVGMKWRLSDNWSLYTGAYLDYGLNNVAKDKLAPFIEYNTNDPEHFMINSVVHSQYPSGNLATAPSFTNKVAPLAAGIKLRLAFGTGKKAAPAPAPAPAPPPPPPPAPAPAPEPPATVAPPPPPPPVVDDSAEKARQAAKAKIQEPIDGYPLGHTIPNAKQKEELDKRIALLKEYPDMEIFIYGHTCEIGGDKVNERIGLGRADKAKAYLISKGIDAKRFVGTASKLDREPVAPNTNETNRKKNRRVVITITN